jgi:leader peptidase (prepilin peptidase)/N-methyltransferase
MVWLPFDVLYRRLRGRTGMAMGDAKLVLLAGAWFGIRGAVFVFLAGALQGTIAAVVQFIIKGKLEDPAAVERERAAILAEIDALPPEEQAAAREELKEDPLFEEGGGGALGARMPFGPFLALATLEYLLVGRDWLDGYLALLW